MLNFKIHGFTLLEFFLSMIAIFLLLIITYPIFKECRKITQIDRIEENLKQLKKYSDEYFEVHPQNFISIFELVGPQKAIRALDIIADEEYPEIIFRNKVISAESVQLGRIILY